ncbi:MAG: tail fiber protein [Flavobacteriaceae bacterium]|nr:tail fiber protein [Flavobacteriaceae bacterium]
MQPYLAVKYYIALTGTFPSRSNDPKILNDPNVITSSRSAQGLNPFIGEIMLYAGILVPSGWAECNGQLLPIASNAALFSLLGTTYGGDGITTFALPDLRGRVPMHYGNGPGLTNRQWGENGGSETVD